MKACHIISRFVFVLWLCLILLSNPLDAQVIPTDQWITCYSKNTIFQGGAVPVGAVIEAYDADSVRCGTFTVTTPGEYGFLFVYRDDTLTVGVDEGAIPGDTINFKINGFPVKALGPDPNTWTGNGDIFEVNLADNLSPSILDTTADLVLTEDAPDTIIAELDTLFFDPDNDSLKFSVQSSSPVVVPEIDEASRLIISLAPDASGEAVVIVTAQDDWFTIHDTLLIQVLEINDSPWILNLPDTSFSSDMTLTIDLNNYVKDVDHPKSSLSWTAGVESAFDDSVLVEIDNTEKLATFTARYIFSANVAVIFTVTDDSSASDTDTIIVRVKLPADVERKAHNHQPQSYSLSQNYPNPFNSTTVISYQLPKSCQVKLEILNSLGQQVAMLVNNSQNSGYYSTEWDASSQVSGLYFLRIEAGKFSQVKKMMLLR